ncbi:glycosyltransferase [Coprobacillus sp. AM37-9BH]|nr:glycosyltransferase [Coprobacillus sp. AM37-9BH]
MEQKFSILMSLYFKEKVEYARECFESLLNQTVPATEWIIVEDGPLTKELYDLLDEYQNKYPNLIIRVPLEKNVGLGLALREGILYCNYDLIARMDTDDIARKDRFKLQLNEFNKNPNLDICGSHILEFEGNIKNIVSKRNVPIDNKQIEKYQKRRDAFNHMTVMYKKKAVLKAGNYQSCLLMEDTLLWVNMIQSGAVCSNIDDYLVYARVGKDMYDRRGGWAYLKKYRIGRKRVFKTGYISNYDYLYTIVVQVIVSLIPRKLREFIFKTILHN